MSFSHIAGCGFLELQNADNDENVDDGNEEGILLGMIDKDERERNLGGQSKRKNSRWFATYATGIVYGFNPDAVMVIVPALALPSQLAIVSYILAFCTGTVIAMGGYTGCIGATSNMLSKKVPKINNVLSLVSSGIATALGIALAFAGALGVDIGL